MHTPDGCNLTEGDRVIVHANYLAPHPVGGGRVVLRTGMRDEAVFDVPISSVTLNRTEPAEWLAVAKPMHGTRAHYLGLYRRTNTGTWGQVTLWGGPDDEHLDGIFTVLDALGVLITIRTDLEGTDDDPLPQVIEGSAS